MIDPKDMLLAHGRSCRRAILAGEVVRAGRQARLAVQWSHQLTWDDGAQAIVVRGPWRDGERLRYTVERIGRPMGQCYCVVLARAVSLGTAEARGRRESAARRIEYVGPIGWGRPEDVFNRV